MVNYYKILGLENYASVDEVKLAYKAKIKVLHPDISSAPDAEEVTQYLNQAKDALSTDEAKDTYDRKLKLAYIVEIQRLQNIKNNKPMMPNINVRERMANMEEERKLQIKKKYESGISRFPFSYRLIGISLLALWGLQIIYSYYFLYYGSLDRIRIIIGLVIFCLSMVLGANEAYSRYVAKSVDTPFRFNYERIIGWVFVFAFFIGPASVSALNNWRKSYHLENNYEFAFAKIKYEESSVDGTVLQYQVDGAVYKRLVDRELSEIIHLQSGQTIIKYAKVNPLICVALSPKEAQAMPREL